MAEIETPPLAVPKLPRMSLEGARRLLTEPSARALDLDDPRARIVHGRIIRRKAFLWRIYEEWYDCIAAKLAQGYAPALELGSGEGFLKQRVPRMLASDVVPGPSLDLVADARELPFAAGALRGIAMVNVFHHLASVRGFLTEAARSVRPGGLLLMVEPWRSAWSELVYRRLHHEPFDSAAPEWDGPAIGPMTGANGALPWIVFHRDRQRFETDYPQWRIESVRPTMPLRYLLSGGLSMRSLVPGWSFGLWKGFERLLTPWMRHVAMFALIDLRRTPYPPLAPDPAPRPSSESAATDSRN